MQKQNVNNSGEVHVTEQGNQMLSLLKKNSLLTDLDLEDARLQTYFWSHTWLLLTTLVSYLFRIPEHDSCILNSPQARVQTRAPGRHLKALQCKTAGRRATGVASAAGVLTVPGNIGHAG